MTDATNRKLIRDGEAKQAQPMRPLGDYVVTSKPNTPVSKSGVLPSQAAPDMESGRYPMCSFGA